MKLLLDLGNTRLKWACEDGGRLTPSQAVPWDALEAGGLPAECLESARHASEMWAASVAGASREALVGATLRGQGAIEPTWVRSPAEACGVRNAYRIPDKLGVDRFLAMVAAHHAGLAPCVVVSAGTALTLDALAADGRHLGGLIAPGPRLMQRSLHRAAAQLPDAADAPLSDIADDTESAIASGSWQAALGLVERFHARMAATLGNEAGLLLSGGDADVLAAQLDIPARIQADLVLRGLAVWAADPPAAS